MTKLLRFLLLPFVLFFSFFNFYKFLSAGYFSTLHIDEHLWVARGYFFELLLKRDFDNLLWDTYGESPGAGLDGDPKLAPYVYGIFAYPEYLRQKKVREDGGNYDMVKFLIDKNMLTRFMNQTVSEEYEEYKREVGFIDWDPSKAHGKTFESLVDEFGEGFRETADFILSLRTASYIFTALSVVIAYLIVLALNKSLPMAVLTGIFYGASRVIVDSTSFATTEGLFLFLFNFGLLLLVLIFSKKVTNKWLLFAFGLTVALCNQTKLNGILLLFIFNFLIFFTIVLKPHYLKDLKRHLISILVVNLVFTLFYIGLNPSLYKNTTRNLNFQYVWTYEVAKNLQKIYPGARLDTPSQRLGFIFNTLFKKQGLQPSFVNWEKNEERNLFAAPFLWVLFVVGFAALVIKTIDENKRFFKNGKFNFSCEVVLFFIFLLIFVSTLFYLLHAWERYLVHLVLPAWFVIFYGGRVLLDRLRIIALKNGGRDLA